MKPGLRSLAALLVASLTIIELASCKKSVDTSAPERTAQTEAAPTYEALRFAGRPFITRIPM